MSAITTPPPGSALAHQGMLSWVGREMTPSRRGHSQATAPSAAIFTTRLFRVSHTSTAPSSSTSSMDGLAKRHGPLPGEPAIPN